MRRTWIIKFYHDFWLCYSTWNVLGTNKIRKKGVWLGIKPKFSTKFQTVRVVLLIVSICKKIRRIFWAPYFSRKTSRLIDNREKLVKNTVLSIPHVTPWPLIEFFMLKWTLTIRTTNEWNILHSYLSLVLLYNVLFTSNREKTVKSLISRHYQFVI